MSKTIRILAILAVVQVVAAAVLMFGGTTLSSTTPRSTLFDFEAAIPDKLTIRDNENTVELVKGDGDDAVWKTADDFPVEQAKVTSLLDKLKGLKTSFPVATSDSAFKRFKLADDDFERYIELEQAGKAIGSLYLGSGAGARRTHARYGDDPAVYSLNIGAYDASSDLNEWLDKGVLQLKAEDLETVAFGELEFEKVDKAWKVSKLPEGKTLIQTELDNALSPLLSLRFSKLLGKESKVEYGLDKPEFTMKLKHKAGEREYRLGKLKDADDYVLKVSDRPEFFRIAAYSVKPFLEKIAEAPWFMDNKSETKPESEAAPETKTE